MRKAFFKLAAQSRHSEPLSEIESILIQAEGSEYPPLTRNDLPHWEIGMYDSSYGQILLSQKDRSFKVVAAFDSGLSLEGEIKDIMTMQLKDRTYLIFARNDTGLVSYSIF